MVEVAQIIVNYSAKTHFMMFKRKNGCILYTIVAVMVTILEKVIKINSF